MKINNYEQYLIHPEACYIPWPIFKNIFFCELEDDHIHLISGSFTELIEQPFYIASLRQDSHRLRAWLCIAYAHSTISDDHLLAIARKMNMSTSLIAQGVVLIERFNLFNSLCQKAHKDIMKGFADHDYKIYRILAEQNHVTMLFHILNLFPSEVKSVLRANHYEIFFHVLISRNTADVQNLFDLLFIAQKTSIRTGLSAKLKFTAEVDDLHNIIGSEPYAAYALANYQSHYELISKLVVMAPQHFMTAVKLNRYHVFHAAIENNNLAMIDGLIDRLPKIELMFMIQAGGYQAALIAAEHGNVNILSRLFAIFPRETINIIQANHYQVFRTLVKKVEAENLELIIRRASFEAVSMLRANNNEAVKYVIQQGNLRMLNKMVSWIAANEFLSIIQANRYAAFEIALTNNHFGIIIRLLELAGDDIKNMISAHGRYLLNLAKQRNDFNLIKIGFMVASLFAEAELEAESYGPHVHQFVAEKISELKAMHAVVESDVSEPPFNVQDPEEARICFYMMRYLIRSGDSTRHDELRFLAFIPSVNALLHTMMTPNQENELLRLAISRNDFLAVNLLYSMPEVRRLAIANRYYATATHIDTSFDLREFVRRTESSMDSLSSIEEKQFRRLNAHYQPIIDQLGMDKLWDDLQAWLVGRYEANPATIEIDGRVRQLPTNRADFDRIQFSTNVHINESQRNAALIKYYQHTCHSALRYFMIPNLWIHENALYVLSHPVNTRLRWANFEYFKSFIVLLWIAAKDENSPPVDQYSIEGRIEQFIKAIALIARAHNWDRTRPVVDERGNYIYKPKKNTKGDIEYDLSGRPILERLMQEYDDLEADRPSCSAGLRKRLISALVGHELCQIEEEAAQPILTQLMIDQALRDFVVTYFRQKINSTNCQRLKDAWENYLIELEPDVAEPLKELNIPQVEQLNFIQRLSVQYGTAFTSQPLLRLYLEGQFSLRETSDPLDAIHLLKFSTWLGEFTMSQIFEPRPILIHSMTVLDSEFNTFKTAYLAAYQAQFFKNPFSYMKVGLKNGSINSMEQVRAHAIENPFSRTAKLLSNLH